MSFLSSLYQLIFGSKQRKPKRVYKKKGKLSKCNILRFNEGVYASDSGFSDYKSYYSVITGNVKKKILKRYPKQEDTYMFNYVQLTPLTKTAYVRVIHEYTPVSPSGHRGKTIWNILLIKSRFRRTIIKLDR
jgi:hypothetical protein